jgi:hypothetical protein
MSTDMKSFLKIFIFLHIRIYTLDIIYNIQIKVLLF